MSLINILYIILGTISLIIGLVGIVVPGLPTTPFILLTAGLYLKSSDKLYQKLINNKIIGSYIAEYQNNKGMTKKSKLFAIGIMWVMITISCIFFITPFYVKIIVAAAGVVGSFVTGFIVPTVIISKKKFIK